jgi:hypothetical protein
MELPTVKDSLMGDVGLSDSKMDDSGKSESAGGDIGYLDIPAFLRRQAD